MKRVDNGRILHYDYAIEKNRRMQYLIEVADLMSTP